MTPHRQTEYSIITDHIVVGTNMCCGEHTENLRRLGFAADIDLMEERREDPPRVPAYLWLPVPDSAAPSPTQLALGTALITEVVNRGEKVYIHCENGHGRGPTLAAAYFIRTGMTADEALAFVATRRPEAHPAPAQMDALRAFERARRGAP